MDSRNKTRMKEALFETVQKQIDRGSPVETRNTYARLIRTGYTRDQAMRLISSVLLSEMNLVMQTKKPFDEDRYTKALRALPRLT